MKRIYPLVILCLATLPAHLSLHAALISVASDDWTSYPTVYSNNDNLNGLPADGPGLTGNWTVANASVGVRRISGTMSYSNFAAAGNVTGGIVRPGNNFQNPTLSASLSSPQAGEIYVQYLFRFNNLPLSDTSNTDIGIRMNIGSTGIGFYIPGNSNGVNGIGNIFIDGGWGGSNSELAVFAENTTYLMLGRLEHDGNQFTTASVWLNPEGTEYDNITSSAASVTGIDISGIGLAELSIASFTWNDRRGADSPAMGGFDIIAIPEPGTSAAIFGLMALGLMIWRRRRSK